MLLTRKSKVLFYKIYFLFQTYVDEFCGIGTQNDLDQKLEEIVCSIGFNTSALPAEVVTTSPISKSFISMI
jgi:hypothetical protein